MNANVLARTAVALAVVTASAVVVPVPGGPAIVGTAWAEADPLLTKSRTLAVEYQDRLRAQLQQAMKAGGPLLALDVCKGAAPTIAEEMDKASGATIWRVSLQARNPKGVPDSWQQATLEQFRARRAAGEDPATIEAYERTQGGFRYLKAIPMAELCAQCHGTEIKPEVAAKIVELYPNDKATGFKPGDLRGALSISWPAGQ